MMEGMNDGWVMGEATWIITVLLAALVIGALVALFWWLGTPYGIRRGGHRQREKALQVLDERYARGEIAEGDYQRKRRELEA